MARLWSTGFELQSITAGVEVGAVTGSPTINTSIKRSGAASLRVNPTASTAYIQQTVSPTGGDGKRYIRVYVYIATATDALDSIIVLRENTINLCSIRMNANRTLEFWDEPGSVQIGSDTAALNTGEWYRVEISTSSVSGVQTVEAFLDGVSIGSKSISLASPEVVDVIRIGAVTSTTCDLYFDDIAVNDDSGSYQNSLPGSGKIVHLLPNAAGDNNVWLKSGGGAGTSTNYQDVDEITPDEDTSYLRRTSTGTVVDDYNVESSSSQGISTGDTINLVAVGIRARTTSNTANADREVTLRIKGQASGTVQSQADIDISNTGYVTNRDLQPRNYQLHAYINPQDSAAWEPSDLDQMQIGVQADTSSTTELRVSTLWALVEYVPNVAPPATYKPKIFYFG
jgi:hypothetical protein